MTQPTLYEILEITPRATVEEMITARDGLLFRYHPANNPNDPEAVKKMKMVKLAFGVLSDASKRQMYDDGLTAATAKPAPGSTPTPTGAPQSVAKPKPVPVLSKQAAKSGAQRKKALLAVLGVVAVSAGGYVGYDTWLYRGKPGKGIINAGNKPVVDKQAPASDVPVKLEAMDQITVRGKTLKVGDPVESVPTVFTAEEEVPPAKPNPLVKSYRADKQTYVLEFAAAEKTGAPTKITAIRQELPMTLLDAAANELDLTGEVQALLAVGADVNTKAGDGTTALHVAARKGRTEIAKFLISKGAKVDERNAEGQTPLRLAVLGGNRNTVALLLGLVKDVLPEVDQEGNTLLHIAANQNFNEIAALLLDKGVPIDATNKAGNTALHQAAARANRSLVEMLILKGAALSIRNLEGQTALAMVNKNNTMLYNYLLEKTPTDLPKVAEKAKPVAVDSVKLAEEARQIDQAWSRYYKQEGKCDTPVSIDVMRECVNSQMRAREKFEQEWRAGKVK